jgi:hypothetical protein
LIVLALSGIGFAGIGRSLSNVHAWWLVAALALNGLSMFLRAVSWQAVLRAALPDVRLRSLVVVRATMIGVLVSALIPGRFGEPARAYLVARRAGDTARRFPLVLGTVFAQTLINLVALAILAAITIASLALIRGHATALIAAVSVPIAVVALVVAGPALLARAKRSHRAHLSRTVRWLSDQIIQVAGVHPAAARGWGDRRPARRVGGPDTRRLRGPVRPQPPGQGRHRRGGRDPAGRQRDRAGANHPVQHRHLPGRHDCRGFADALDRLDDVDVVKVLSRKTRRPDGDRLFAR